eukprot:XP_001698213.1 predicted protein [Chlamydomonas reinhardtii]
MSGILQTIAEDPTAPIFDLIKEGRVTVWEGPVFGLTTSVKYTDFLHLADVDVAPKPLGACLVSVKWKESGVKYKGASGAHAFREVVRTAITAAFPAFAPRVRRRNPNSGEKPRSQVFTEQALQQGDVDPKETLRNMCDIAVEENYVCSYAFVERVRCPTVASAFIYMRDLAIRGTQPLRGADQTVSVHVVFGVGRVEPASGGSGAVYLPLAGKPGAWGSEGSEPRCCAEAHVLKAGEGNKKQRRGKVAALQVFQYMKRILTTAGMHMNAMIQGDGGAAMANPEQLAAGNSQGIMDNERVANAKKALSRVVQHRDMRHSDKSKDWEGVMEALSEEIQAGVETHQGSGAVSSLRHVSLKPLRILFADDLAVRLFAHLNHRFHLGVHLDYTSHVVRAVSAKLPFVLVASVPVSDVLRQPAGPGATWEQQHPVQGLVPLVPPDDGRQRKAIGAKPLPLWLLVTGANDERSTRFGLAGIEAVMASLGGFCPYYVTSDMGKELAGALVCALNQVDVATYIDLMAGALLGGTGLPKRPDGRPFVVLVWDASHVMKAVLKGLKACPAPGGGRPKATPVWLGFRSMQLMRFQPNYMSAELLGAVLMSLLAGPSRLTVGQEWRFPLSRRHLSKYQKDALAPEFLEAVELATDEELGAEASELEGAGRHAAGGGGSGEFFLTGLDTRIPFDGPPARQGGAAEATGDTTWFVHVKVRPFEVSYIVAIPAPAAGDPIVVPNYFRNKDVALYLQKHYLQLSLYWVRCIPGVPKQAYTSTQETGISLLKVNRLCDQAYTLDRFTLTMAGNYHAIFDRLEGVVPRRSAEASAISANRQGMEVAGRIAEQLLRREPPPPPAWVGAPAAAAVSGSARRGTWSRRNMLDKDVTWSQQLGAALAALQQIDSSVTNKLLASEQGPLYPLFKSRVSDQGDVLAAWRNSISEKHLEKWRSATTTASGGSSQLPPERSAIREALDAYIQLVKQRLHRHQQQHSQDDLQQSPLPGRQGPRRLPTLAAAVAFADGAADEGGTVSIPGSPEQLFPLPSRRPRRVTLRSQGVDLMSLVPPFDQRQPWPLLRALLKGLGRGKKLYMRKVSVGLNLRLSSQREPIKALYQQIRDRFQGSPTASDRSTDGSDEDNDAAEHGTVPDNGQGRAPGPGPGSQGGAAARQLSMQGGAAPPGLGLGGLSFGGGALPPFTQGLERQADGLTLPLELLHRAPGPGPGSQGGAAARQLSMQGGAAPSGLGLGGLSFGGGALPPFTQGLERQADGLTLPLELLHRAPGPGPGSQGGAAARQLSMQGGAAPSGLGLGGLSFGGGALPPFTQGLERQADGLTLPLELLHRAPGPGPGSQGGAAARQLSMQGGAAPPGLGLGGLSFGGGALPPFTQGLERQADGLTLPLELLHRAPGPGPGSQGGAAARQLSMQGGAAPSGLGLGGLSFGGGVLPPFTQGLERQADGLTLPLELLHRALGPGPGSQGSAAARQLSMQGGAAPPGLGLGGLSYRRRRAAPFTQGLERQADGLTLPLELLHRALGPGPGSQGSAAARQLSMQGGPGSQGSAAARQLSMQGGAAARQLSMQGGAAPPGLGLGGLSYGGGALPFTQGLERQADGLTLPLELLHRALGPGPGSQGSAAARQLSMQGGAALPGLGLGGLSYGGGTLPFTQGLERQADGLTLPLELLHRAPGPGPGSQGSAAARQLSMQGGAAARQLSMQGGAAPPGLGLGGVSFGGGALPFTQGLERQADGLTLPPELLHRAPGPGSLPTIKTYNTIPMLYTSNP